MHKITKGHPAEGSYYCNMQHTFAHSKQQEFYAHTTRMSNLTYFEFFLRVKTGRQNFEFAYLQPK